MTERKNGPRPDVGPDTTKVPETQAKQSDLSRAEIRTIPPEILIMNEIDAVNVAFEKEKTNVIVGETVAERDQKRSELKMKGELLQQISSEAKKGRSVKEIVAEMRNEAEQVVNQAQSDLEKITSEYAKSELTDADQKEKDKKIREVLPMAQQAEIRVSFLKSLEAKLPVEE